MEARKLTRQQVYLLLDGERLYQDERWNQPDTLRVDLVLDENKSVAEWLIYLDILLRDAKVQVYNLNRDHALAMVRKLTAVGVACLEVHGCPERRQPATIAPSLFIGGLKAAVPDNSRPEGYSLKEEPPEKLYEQHGPGRVGDPTIDPDLSLTLFEAIAEIKRLRERVENAGYRRDAIDMG